jgi:hypothetical protein
MGVLSFLTTPSAAINYKIITILYASTASLFFLFYILEQWLVTLDPSHWAVDNLDSVKGVYIIGVPFFPFTAWSFFMWIVQERSGGYVEISRVDKNKKFD